MTDSQRLPLTAAAGGLDCERRGAARHAWGREVALRLLSDARGVVRWASAQDLSGGGIGLLLSCPFQCGALLTLELRGRKGVSRAVVGRVVHIREGPQGNAYLGCAFEEALPEDDLQALLA